LIGFDSPNRSYFHAARLLRPAPPPSARLARAALPVLDSVASILCCPRRHPRSAALHVRAPARECLAPWKQALWILKPATLLRWHRQGFRLFWRLTTRARPGRPRLSQALVNLIQPMAAENPGWGAERIRGELLKLGLRIAQDTLHTYLRRVRPAGLPRIGTPF
jgi:hypothetical protein